jgi:hypothetical protein
MRPPPIDEVRAFAETLIFPGQGDSHSTNAYRLLIPARTIIRLSPAIGPGDQRQCDPYPMLTHLIGTLFHCWQIQFYIQFNRNVSELKQMAQWLHTSHLLLSDLKWEQWYTELDKLTKEVDEASYVLFSNRCEWKSTFLSYSEHQRYVIHDLQLLVTHIRGYYMRHGQQKDIMQLELNKGDHQLVMGIRQAVSDATENKINHLDSDTLKIKPVNSAVPASGLHCPTSLGLVQPLPPGIEADPVCRVEYDNVVNYLHQTPEHPNTQIIQKWLHLMDNDRHREFQRYVSNRRKTWSTIATHTDGEQGQQRAHMLWAQTLWLAERRIKY